MVAIAREYCSLSCNVVGVKFYDGINELHSLMHARLFREPSNPKDCNAVFVKTKSMKILGHLEAKTAALISPLMDANLPGFIIKA
jgi:hypothetical protein